MASEDEIFWHPDAAQARADALEKALAELLDATQEAIDWDLVPFAPTTRFLAAIANAKRVERMCGVPASAWRKAVELTGADKSFTPND